MVSVAHDAVVKSPPLPSYKAALLLDVYLKQSCELEISLASEINIWTLMLPLFLQAGDIVLSEPEVRQVTLPASGGRVIIASDGLWDCLAPKTAAHHVRGMPATKAARELVQVCVSSLLHFCSLCSEICTAKMQDPASRCKLTIALALCICYSLST